MSNKWLQKRKGSNINISLAAIMAATRYAYVAIYQKPRHVVGTDTFLGRVEVQCGVVLALCEGTFSMAEFAAAVRDHGTPWRSGHFSRDHWNYCTSVVRLCSLTVVVLYVYDYAWFHIMIVEVCTRYSMMACTVQVRHSSSATWVSASPSRWATPAPTARHPASKPYL